MVPSHMTPKNNCSPGKTKTPTFPFQAAMALLPTHPARLPETLSPPCSPAPGADSSSPAAPSGSPPPASSGPSRLPPRRHAGPQPRLGQPSLPRREHPAPGPVPPTASSAAARSPVAIGPPPPAAATPGAAKRSARPAGSGRWRPPVPETFKDRWAQVRCFPDTAGRAETAKRTVTPYFM